MAKEKEQAEKLFVGVVWKCPDVKILLTVVLFLCTVATLLQLAPLRLPFFLRLTPPISTLPCAVTSVVSDSPPPPPPPPPPPERFVTTREEVTESGAVKRVFDPYGSAAYLFVQMGAYRGGPDTFAVVGLASKPLHRFGRPTFECRWIPANGSDPVNATGARILPDWGYGRVYTVVVVNCTFPTAVGADGSGGRLVLIASTNDPADLRTAEIPSLSEPPGGAPLAALSAQPKYDYLYCGSSLFGRLSPQRLREWVAYHVKFFGPGRAHFVLHDAGGVHGDVAAVLRPWMEKGYVTLQDITGQEEFDGYYHNQFMVVNDCLHRYRFTARWMFFFDVDEYMYVPAGSTIDAVVGSLQNYTQFTIEQMPMSSKICPQRDMGRTARMWGIEKLVYKDVKKGMKRDRKYAIQPRNVFATGVHMSQNLVGWSEHRTYGRIMYYHYHGSITEQEPCREYANSTSLTVDGTPFVLDATMRKVAASVKRFELKVIGSRLKRTRQ